MCKVRIDFTGVRCVFINIYLSVCINKCITYIFNRLACRGGAVRSASQVFLLCHLRIQTAALSVSVQDTAETVRSREDSTKYL